MKVSLSHYIAVGRGGLYEQEAETTKEKDSRSFSVKRAVFLRVLMFSAVIVRLGYVQIVRGEEYKNEVERKENSTISNPVPRGKIFDRYGRAVVDNAAVRTITFTK